MRAALHVAGNTATLKSSLVDPSTHRDKPGIRTHSPVLGMEGQPNAIVDVAMTSTQFHRAKTAQLKFQQKYRKYANAVQAQPNLVLRAFSPTSFRYFGRSSVLPMLCLHLSWFVNLIILRLSATSCSGKFLRLSRGHRGRCRTPIRLRSLVLLYGADF